MNSTKNSHEKMRVIRAIKTESETGANGYWFKIGTDQHALWISADQLIEAETAIFKRLTAGGLPCFTAAAKNHVKNLVQAHTIYESGLVAERPGWCERFYVFGDGTVAAPPDQSADDVIIGFEPIAKFRQRGNLANYKSIIEPIIKNQPLPIFALLFALVPPLLRFAPADVTTYPMIELVGPRQSGKSVIACLAASVWAGADRPTGGAETWDLTEGVLDDLKQHHNDGLLVLDEANLAGSNRQQRADLIAKATFKLASNASKRRMTERERPSTRQMMLSTSNEPLRDIVKGADHVVIDALSSRLLTILVNDEHGVLHTVPKDFDSAQDAIEMLRRRVANNYGTLGRAFVARLVSEAATGKNRLRKNIREAIAEFCDHAEDVNDSARALKVFGLVYAASRLAESWGLIRLSSASARKMLTHLFLKQLQRPQSAIEKVAAYVEANEIKAVGKTPLSRQAFERAAGFSRVRAEKRELLISTVKFTEEFSDAATILRELDRADRLQVEKGGAQRKLSIKAPQNLCASGRVYAIKLGTGA